MRKNIIKTLILTGILLGLSSAQAWAGAMPTPTASGTLGGMMLGLQDDIWVIGQIAVFFAFVTGIFFIALGLYKAKNHVELGPQSVQLADPIKFLLAGGMMVAITTLLTVAINTSGDTGAVQTVGNVGWAAVTNSAADITLVSMFQNLIKDTYTPFLRVFEAFCIVVGVIFLLVTFNRLTKTAQEGPRGPAGMGTIATFLLSGIFLSMPSFVGMLTETLYDGRSSYLTIKFMTIDPSLGANSAYAQNVLLAILMFLIIVGLISIAKGLFVLKGVAEGNQQMTMLSGVSHVLAGAVLVNFGQFANIIQKTLGIDTYGVLFGT